jgi:hypothetical protein
MTSRQSDFAMKEKIETERLMKYDFPLACSFIKNQNNHIVGMLDGII